MASIYCKSKWSAEQLNDKTVQFLVLNDENRLVLGKGIFSAIEHENGLEVRIQEIIRGHGDDLIYTYHSLTQEAINCINLHPISLVADYELISIFDPKSAHKNTFIFPK